jgi:hypothetical protein
MADQLGEGMPPFAMLTLDAPGAPLLAALRVGAISIEDAGVFLVLAQSLNWRSARYWGGPDQLAVAAGCSVEVIEQGLSRLERAGLVVHGRCTRLPSRRYWAPLPSIVCTGGPVKRRHQWISFFREANNPDAVAEHWEAAAAAAGR